MACAAPEEPGTALCGVKDVSATPYYLSFLPFTKPDTGATKVAVIAEKRDNGLALKGEFVRQQVCETVTAITVSPDTDFISHEDWQNNGQVLSSECKVLAL
ncbi:MAG: hypothetical protein KDJ75_04260 [Alphaproteobacteria bacterium]|nr:hypothetical protein [Alphaproteobacteria bacterium]